MNLKRLIASAIALSLTLSGCATMEERVETPPPGAVPGPALWRVNDQDTTIYLFGTVHFLTDDASWFDSRIERAFSASGELVTELDTSDPAAMALAMQQAGMLPEGQTLRGLMSSENRVQYEAALVSLGLAVESFDRVEPWLATILLTQIPLLRAGYNPASGVELSLQGKADDKKRAGLEAVADQIALFDSLPMDAQLALLDETVEAAPGAKASLDAIVAEWREGDAAELARLLNAEMTDPALHARLLTERNANWAQWIEGRLVQPGTVFIAVGAGHLAGAGSVQQQLRTRGYEVERVWQ